MKAEQGKPIDLILMAGYPGVGKSAIAVELARALRYPLFDIDDIRTEVNLLSGIEEWDLRGRLSYRILQELVEKQLRLGVSVIVDTPLTHKWLRNFMFNLKEKYGATVHVIYCHCSDTVALERNRKRYEKDPEKHVDRDPNNFYRIKGLFQPIESIASICVDTEREVADNVALILEHLAGRRAMIQETNTQLSPRHAGRDQGGPGRGGSSG